MENLQHIQVPHMPLKDRGIEFIDPYVYACIKRHVNKDTKHCFPGIRCLIEESGLSRETIMQSIERLETAGYLQTVRSFGKSTKYIFSEYKQFEIFSYEFLDKQDLSPREKAYLIATQQFMFKHPETGEGTMTYSNNELADLIGISYHTLLKYEKTLKNKRILTYLPTKVKDPDTGLYKEERVFDFTEFANAIAFEFNKVENDIDYIKKQNQIQQNEITALRKEIEKIKAATSDIIIL